MRVLRLALCLIIALAGGPLQAERQAFLQAETRTEAPAAGTELAQFRRGFGGYRAPVYRPPVYRPPPIRTIPRAPPIITRPAPPRAPPPVIPRSIPKAVPKIAAPPMAAPKTLVPPKIVAASPRLQPGRTAAPALRPILRSPSVKATLPTAVRGVPGSSAQRLAAGVRTGRTMRFMALSPRAGVLSAGVPRGDHAAPISGRAAKTQTLQASRAQRQKGARAATKQRAFLVKVLSSKHHNRNGERIAIIGKTVGFVSLTSESGPALNAGRSLIPTTSYSLGLWGEARLKAFLDGAGTKPVKPHKTSSGWRYFDRLEKKGDEWIAHESKAGRNAKLTISIRRQIAKDVEIKKVGLITPRWHFWNGADHRLLNELEESGIEYIVHE